jgi:hypothetical protein
MSSKKVSPRLPTEESQRHCDRHNPNNKDYAGEKSGNPCSSAIPDREADRRADIHNPNNPDYIGSKK